MDNTKKELKNETGDEEADQNHTEMIPLHWQKNIERRGLGDLLCKANHIALTVSDIGRSLWFYSDVLGLQQIRRPNFDRHGAWLTMGNIELHLILGPPHVPDGNSLIVGHISLETNNIREVLRRLKAMEVPFETNVSVPKGDESEGVVTQFFLRDPDGYYIELCNCDILTDFCLGNSKVHIEGYEESGTAGMSISVLSKMLVLANRAKERNMESKITSTQTLEKFEKNKQATVEEEVDEEKLSNLLKRTKIYGDIVQGEDEVSLREILKACKNNVPEAIAYIKAKHQDGQVYQPPTIYKNNEEEYKPAVLTVKK